MKARRFCCLLLTFALIAPAAAASELQNAISRLRDEDLMDLYGMIALEMYQRDLSPDTIIQHVNAQQTRATQTNAPQAASAAPDSSILDSMQEAYAVISSIPQTEIFTTYDPPATPKPTFAPLIQLGNDDAVWISKTGKRYHTMPDCSGMRTAREVTLAYAVSQGLTPCRDCAYWLAGMGE